MFAPLSSARSCCSPSSFFRESSRVLVPLGILENFIHHNPLKALEAEYTFDGAIALLDQLDKYMTPGERAFILLKVDPRKRVRSHSILLPFVITFIISFCEAFPTQ